jgi:O-methyltransferase involved in polyketide biosynthesis
MEQPRASVTALGAALMRAVHTRLAPSPLIDDLWGDRIVLEAEREVVLNVVLNGLSPRAREQCEKHGAPSAVLDAALQLHPGYGWAILRTRYAEDALSVAVRRGVRFLNGSWELLEATFTAVSAAPRAARVRG